MSPATFATILALFSATLHATWNLIVKTSNDRDLATLAQIEIAGLFGVAALAFTGLPGTAAIWWLIGSGLVHIGYFSFLIRCYELGDFSLAYPLARGSGATLAALGGITVLGDSLTALSALGIGVVALGLVSLVQRPVSVRAITMALATGACIATYTLIDSHGARVASSGAAYGFSTMVTNAAITGSFFLRRVRPGVLYNAFPKHWPRFLLAGACLAGAYTLALVAVRHAPVGQVAMLRESSVVLGALAGWLLLKEKLGARRLVSSAVILSGLILLVVGS